MANVFGILTAIVLAVSAFVAYQNKNAYQREITATSEGKDEIVKSRARLKLAQDTLASAKAERNGVDGDNVKLAETEADQKKINTGLESDKSGKATKTAANKEKLDEIRDKTSKIGDIKELASKMRRMNAELEELAQSVSSTEAKLANLTAQNTEAQRRVDSLTNDNAIMNSGQSLPLKTRIRSIYPSWGFVTLAAGNSAGVVINSTLDVIRDGVPVAKLLVTAVETSTSSASIIPDSLAQDVTLMIGDRVESTKKADQPAAARN